MNDQREQKIHKWNVRLDPIRFTNRENGIKEWLVQNNAKRFLTLTEELLSSLPKEELISDAEDILIDLFQIWNYRIGLEACDYISAESKNILKKRKPFWITMSRHERWAVPIGLI
ncbi:hypothetical protein [Leptospira santarosai]|uniref:hypothetical protein n=1 Tax=Leptospira santarosai TaxID=28183 RepID=UPI0024AF2CDB|nr:hypothetical protein [Leptospira santarosai]MDI7189323.1 hypothetical protein [Leptospira santarosai]MDI7205720.1 hypothetical protein [Leptospira santarosai]MDI7209530.1 hypothetical protein [Leptospira santarosai]MDI7213421.1 hypothetical protein [Leptospira santarosai]MDI7220853.1 hypothetical protein [Leptospira santarosai]